MGRLRIGVVGLRFGARIVRQLRNSPLFEVAAVCDHDAARAAEVAARAGVPVRANLADLLADDDLAAVALFTPPAGRARLVRRVLRAGRHVMTTKPFELDPGEAQDVLAEARALDRVVHLNSPAQALPADLRQIDRWRSEYHLGQAVAGRGEVWTSYHEQLDGSWYDDAARCPVAPVLRLGIYLINDLVWLLGEPAAVQVLQSRLRTGRPTADNAQVGILFANGTVANVFASFCVDDGRDYNTLLTVNYTGGTVTRRSRATSPVGTAELALVASGQVTAETTTSGGSGDYDWESFHRAVSGHGNRLADNLAHKRIVAGVRIIEAMARAQQSGCTEQV